MAVTFTNPPTAVVSVGEIRWLVHHRYSDRALSYSHTQNSNSIILFVFEITSRRQLITVLKTHS